MRPEGATFYPWVQCLALGAAMTVVTATPISAWAGEMVHDPNGFAGIAWGSALSEVPDLIAVDTGDRIQQYESRRRPVRLGETEVDVLRFISIERQFARVTIHYHGQQSHHEVLRYLQLVYGPIEQIPGSMMRGLNQQFTWRGSQTEVNLSYDGGRERGHLFIESRTLAPRFNDVLPEHAF